LHTEASEERLLDYVKQLEEELEASRRTNAVLVRRVETMPLNQQASELSLKQVMVGLEEAVRASTQRLKEREEHLRTLYDRGPDMMCTVDRAGRILERNRLAVALGEAEQLPELFARPGFIEGLIRADFVGVGEQELELRDGRRVLLAVARLPGEQWRYHVVLRDISGFRALEHELHHSRRLAAMGRLAAGIAKEINNPLAVILGRLELLAALGYSEPELLARHLAVVTDHAQRIAQFVQNLDVLARPGKGPAEELLLEGLLEDVEVRCGRRLGNIRISRSIEPPELRVRANPALVAQAFGAIFNACGDAMRRQGRLEVRAWSEEGQCVLDLRGPGLSGVAGELSHLDDLEADGGMNRVSLGLAATILADHGGWLGAVGEGSAAFLRVFLPAVPPRSALRAAGADGVRVLVVEDEEPMAELLEELLRTAGHSSRVVLSAEDALARLERETFDAVICDLVLPGMSGVTLLETLGERWPALRRRVILISGFSQGSFQGARFLHKPFTRAQLLESLALVMQE
jgi:two-component system NtrC family sensor kinase